MIDKSKFPNVTFYDNEGEGTRMRACNHMTKDHYLEVWEIVHDDPEKGDDKSSWRVVEFLQHEEVAELDVSSFEAACHTAQRGQSL